MRYRRERDECFPPLKSKVRQRLLESILAEPLSAGGACPGKRTSACPIDGGEVETAVASTCSIGCESCIGP